MFLSPTRRVHNFYADFARKFRVFLPRFYFGAFALISRRFWPGRFSGRRVFLSVFLRRQRRKTSRDLDETIKRAYAIV